MLLHFSSSKAHEPPGYGGSFANPLGVGSEGPRNVFAASICRSTLTFGCRTFPHARHLRLSARCQKVTLIFSLRSDGASPNSNALIVRGHTPLISESQARWATTRGRKIRTYRQSSRAGGRASTNTVEVLNPTVREPWQKLKEYFMNWRSRADQVPNAEALLTKRRRRHPWFLRLLLPSGCPRPGP